eukprot:6186395-Pleurochrysis_carterae.AAC.6
MALSCNHEGKHLGSRGYALSDQRETNMYGPYSWHRSFRGKPAELHWAMGFDPGSFTYRGLTQGLLVNYSPRILSPLVLMPLRANHGLHSISREDAIHNALLNERRWQWETREFATSAIHLGSDFGLKQLLGSVAEGVGQNDEKIPEAMRSSLPESEGHRAKVPQTLEAYGSPLPCRRSEANRLRRRARTARYGRFLRRMRNGIPNLVSFGSRHWQPRKRWKRGRNRLLVWQGNINGLTH